MIVNAFFVWQLLLSGACLGYAAVIDIDRGEVDNWIWLVWGGVAALMLYAEFGFSVLLGANLVFSAILSGAVFGVWYLKPEVLGGADVKAIMALSVSLPIVGFLVVANGVILTLPYLVLRAAREKLSFRHWSLLKAPFLPFLFLGLVATAALLIFL